MNGAFGEVHRRATVVRLAVERASLLDVMRHVGDVDAKPEVPARQLVDRDGIVEVARVLTVDGNGRRVAEIGAAPNVAVGDRRPETDRLGNRFVGMRVGNAPLADDDLGVDAGRVDVAEHFGHAPDRAARRRRPARELDADHQSRIGAAFLARRNEDIHQDPAIERHDVSHAVLVAIVAADDPLVGSFEDADDPSLGTASLLDPLDAHDHAIAVHRFVHQRTGNVDVAARFERAFGRNESVSG